MKKGFTTTQLIVAGALGVLTIVLTLPVYIFTMLIPFMGSGLFAGFIASMMAVIILFSFKKFGALTIAILVYGVLAIPTPIGEPPGFVPKILAFFLTGILVDVLFLLLKKESKLNALILGAATMVLITIVLTFLYAALLPPLAKVYLAVLHIMIPMAAVVGASGGLLGRFVYFKISKTAVVKRIQG